MFSICFGATCSHGGCVDTHEARHLWKWKNTTSHHRINFSAVILFNAGYIRTFLGAFDHVIYLGYCEFLHSLERKMLDFLQSGECLCDCDGGPRRTTTSPAEGFVADWGTKENEKDSRSVSEMPAAVLSCLHPTLQKFHKHPITMEGWLRWQHKEFCLWPEETSAILSQFRLNPLLKWLKRAEKIVSVDLTHVAVVEKVKLTKPEELPGFGSHGLKGYKGWTGNSPTGRPSRRSWRKVSPRAGNKLLNVSERDGHCLTDTDTGVGVDPYLFESSWRSSSHRATLAAASPPSCPAQAPCPTSKCTGDTRETRGRPVRRLFMLPAQRATFPPQQKHHRERRLQQMEKWLLLFPAQRFNTRKAALRTNGIKMICGTAGSKRTKGRPPLNGWN